MGRIEIWKSSKYKNYCANSFSAFLRLNNLIVNCDFARRAVDLISRRVVDPICFRFRLCNNIIIRDERETAGLRVIYVRSIFLTGQLGQLQLLNNKFNYHEWAWRMNVVRFQNSNPSSPSTTSSGDIITNSIFQIINFK